MSVEKAIDNFYKLKGRYDIKYNNAKLRIIRSDDALSVKKEAVKKIKPKCVNCKRDVGTRFSTNDRHLRAVCGDEANPCKLNIDIKLGLSNQFTDIQDEISADLNTAKIKIIETKLLLLFGLITEEQMAEGFTQLKTTYKSLIEAENTVKKELSDQQLVLQSEMMPGTAVAVEEEQKIQRKTLAKANEIALGGFISNFRSLIKEYEADESADTKLAKMTDAIDLYLQNILPTLAIIRNLLYSVNTVIQEKKQYKLVQLKSSLREQVFDIEKPEIISNKK